MKNELKISTLSIVCVLCAAIVAPANGATAVRSLGGAGTYSGTSSAATAKSETTTSAATNTVRAGAMRLGTSSGASTRAAASRTAASRVAATPRLSIGKYLAASSAPDKTVINNSSTNGNLQTRIEVLENWMGYKENSDINIPKQFEDLNASVDSLETRASDLRLDVDELAKDIQALSGEYTDVTYANKILTVDRNGTSITYDLAKDFPDMSDIEALQAALNAVTDGLAKDFATNDALIKLEDALKKTIEEKHAAGEYATAAALEDLKSEVEALQGSSATGEDLTKLVNRVQVIEDEYAKKTELTAAIAELEDLIAAVDSAYKAADDEIKAGYVAADTALDGKISAEASARETADTQIRTDIATVNTELAKKQNKLTVTGDVLTWDAENSTLGLTGIATSDSLETLQNTVNTLSADASTDGSVKKQISDAIASEVERADDAYDAKGAAAAALAQADKGVADAASAAAAAQAAADAAAAAQAKADEGVADAALVADALRDYKSLNDEAVAGMKEYLESEIEKRHEAGDYATAAALEELKEIVKGLSGGSTVSVKDLQDKVAEIEENYATVDGVNDAFEQVKTALGDLAYRNTVTADFIDTDLPDGTMAMLKSEGDKTTWVPVSVAMPQDNQ